MTREVQRIEELNLFQWLGVKERGRSLGEGAAEFAPTAPHATPGGAGAAARRARVGRIWRPLRIITGVALLLSLGLHGLLAVKAMGEVPEVEFKDVDDELTIPIDMLEEGPPPAAPAPQPVPNAGAAGLDGPGALDAGAKPVHDAGVPEAADAGADAAPPPKPKPVRDAGGEPLAELGGDGGAADAGTGDAGAGPGATGNDPSSMIGMAGISQGPVNVTLLVNMATIRKHPVGGRLGPLIARIPQWESFIHGNESMVDPVRDTEWILIYGPSLIHTEKDAVLVRYSISDAIVDQALEVMATGGRYDTGVPGVKASLGHADNADRVFLRAGSKLLAVVPPDKAKEFARILKKSSAKPRIDPTEAMRLVVRNPHRQISIPGLKFPTELEELRIWIVPNVDGSASVHAEGTVAPGGECADVATFMNEVLRKLNTGFTQLLTNGMLNKANVTCEEGVPSAQIVASQVAMEKLLTLASTFMGGAQ